MSGLRTPAKAEYALRVADRFFQAAVPIREGLLNRMRDIRRRFKEKPSTELHQEYMADVADLVKLDEIESKWGDPLKREVASGAAEMGPSARYMAKTTNQGYNHAISYVTNLYNAGVRPEFQVTRKRVARMMTDIFLRRGLSKFMSKSLRGAVEERILKEMGVSALTSPIRRAELKASIDKMLFEVGANALSDSPQSVRFNIKGKKGREHSFTAEDIAEYYVDALTKDGGAQGVKLYHQMMQEAGDKLGRMIAEDAVNVSYKSAFLNELNRVMPLDEAGMRRGRRGWMEEAVKMEESGAAPPVMHPWGEMVGEEVASIRRAAGEKTSAAADRLGADLRSFVKPKPMSQKLLGRLFGKEKLSEMGVSLDDIRLRPDFADALEVHAKMLRMRDQANMLSQVASRWIKVSLTGLSSTVYINNVTSQLLFAAGKRGNMPFKIVEDIANDAVMWSDFVNGRLKDPKKLRMMRSAQNNGMSSETMSTLAQEFADIGRGRSPHGNRVGRAIVGSRDWAMKFYGSFDSGFKINEYTNTFMAVESELGKLEVGRSASYTVKKGTVTFTRLGPNEWRVNGRRIDASTKAGSQMLADIIGRRGRYNADRFYVDYSDLSKPAFIRDMSRNSLGGPVAPFFHWFYWAVPRPGHGGLMARWFDSATEFSHSDSPTLNSYAIQKGAEQSMRRGVLTTFGTAVLSLDSERRPIGDALRDSISWGPAAAATTNMRRRLGTNPLTSNVDVSNWSAQDPFMPARMVWNGVWAGVGKYLGSDERIKKFVSGDEKPQTDRDKAVVALVKKQMRGKVMAREDWLRLVGLSGGPLTDLFLTASGHRRYGRPVDSVGLAMDAATLFMGRTPKALLIDAPLAYVAEKGEGPLWMRGYEGQRIGPRKGVGPDPQIETAYELVIRSIFGGILTSEYLPERWGRDSAQVMRVLNKSIDQRYKVRERRLQIRFAKANEAGNKGESKRWLAEMSALKNEKAARKRTIQMVHAEYQMALWKDDEMAPEKKPAKKERRTPDVELTR